MRVSLGGPFSRARAFAALRALARAAGRPTFLGNLLRRGRSVLRTLRDLCLRLTFAPAPALKMARALGAPGDDAFSRLPPGALLRVCEHLEFSDIGRLQTCCRAFAGVSDVFAPESDERIVLAFLREHPDPGEWGLRTLNIAAELGSVALLRVLRRRKHFDTLLRAAACVRCAVSLRESSAAFVLEYLLDGENERAAHADEQPLRTLRFVCAEIMGHVSKLGRVDLLDKLRDEAFAQDTVVRSLTCSGAAETGNLASLTWLSRHGWTRGFEKNVHRCVAQRGSLACLQFLKSQGYQTYAGIMEDAAVSGNLAAMKWLHEEGCTATSTSRVFATLMGHREIVEWMDARGFA